MVVPAWNWGIINVWRKAWGEPLVVPLPEIYTQTGGNAWAWYTLSRYAQQEQGARIRFAGVMTQFWSASEGEERMAMWNTPSQGWSQLVNSIQRDDRSRMPFVPRHVTDIQKLRRIPTCFDC